MDVTTYTPAQRHLLTVMSYVKTDKAIEEMNTALDDYFAKQIDTEMDKLWAEDVITEETIKQWSTEHMRTPYK